MNRPKQDNTKSLPKVIKVGLVDDQPLFRAGICALLKGYEDLNVTLQASNGKDLIEQLKKSKPHIILLDIEMPEMNGIETLLYLQKEHPEIKVTMLTLHNEEEFIFDLITKGANGYLPKDKSVEEVVEAIYKVIQTGSYNSQETNEAMINGSKGLVKLTQFQNFSEKEIEIIRMICKQQTNKEIGDAIGISFRTVEKYRASILEKTGAKNTAGMIMYALKHKLITRVDMI